MAIDDRPSPRFFYTLSHSSGINGETEVFLHWVRVEPSLLQR